MKMNRTSVCAIIVIGNCLACGCVKDLTHHVQYDIGIKKGATLVTRKAAFLTRSGALHPPEKESDVIAYRRDPLSLGKRGEYLTGLLDAGNKIIFDKIEGDPYASTGLSVGYYGRLAGDTPWAGKRVELSSLLFPDGYGDTVSPKYLKIVSGD